MAVPSAPTNLKIFPHFPTSPLCCLGYCSVPRTPPAVSKKFFYARQFHNGRLVAPVARALGEWREYEEAVKRKDLAGALSSLKSIENENPVQLFDASSSVGGHTRSRFGELELFGPQRDWEVLDTCFNTEDMKLVGNAYKFLKDRGLLPNFGKPTKDKGGERGWVKYLYLISSQNYFGSVDQISFV